MELHQFRYFSALAQSASFSKAAELCNISQPSLSAQIAKLEDELGGPLVERNRGNNRPNERGRILLRRGREILHQLDELSRELREFDRGKGGSIRLGCLPTTGAYVLPPLLGTFKLQHPNVEIRLVEGSSPILGQRLITDDLDLAIIDQVGLKPGLDGTELFTEPLFIVLPPKHHLANQSQLEMSQLEHESLILMHRGHGFHDIVLSAFSQAGVKPNIVYESSEVETVQALVKAGLGVSIVPRMVCVHGDLHYTEIAPPCPTRTLLIAHRRNAELSPAARHLSEIAHVELASRFA